MRALRLGLLSTAAINRQILVAAAGSDRVDVVAVGSRDAARAAAYAAEHGIARAHGSYEALLADDAVDAVYVSLPNRMHHEWTMRSLASGRHVLCEKPYSRRPAEVEQAFSAAAASRLVLMEAFMYRHHPQTHEIERLVRTGALGSLVAVRATFSFPLHDLANIRALPELDGGALLDVGCYCVSGARLVAGEPVSVHGEEVAGPTGVDMALYATLRFDGDVVAQVEASFMAPRRQLLEVIGSEAVLVVRAPWRVDWAGDLELVRDGEREVLPVPEGNAYRLQLENLADAVAGATPPLLGRGDAHGQARAIEALYASAETGRTVEL